MSAKVGSLVWKELMMCCEFFKIVFRDDKIYDEFRKSRHTFGIVACTYLLQDW